MNRTQTLRKKKKNEEKSLFHLDGQKGECRNRTPLVTISYKKVVKTAMIWNYHCNGESRSMKMGYRTSGWQLIQEPHGKVSVVMQNYFNASDTYLCFQFCS